MREVRRLTNLLLKLKRRRHKMEAPEVDRRGAVGHDVAENKEYLTPKQTKWSKIAYN